MADLQRLIQCKIKLKQMKRFLKVIDGKDDKMNYVNIAGQLRSYKDLHVLVRLFDAFMMTTNTSVSKEMVRDMLPSHSDILTEEDIQELTSAAGSWSCPKEYEKDYSDLFTKLIGRLTEMMSEVSSL